MKKNPLQARLRFQLISFFILLFMTITIAFTSISVLFLEDLRFLAIIILLLVAFCFFMTKYNFQTIFPRPLKKHTKLQKQILLQLVLFALLLFVADLFMILNGPYESFILFGILFMFGVALVLLCNNLAKMYYNARVQDPLIRALSTKITPNPFYCVTKDITFDDDFSLVRFPSYMSGKVEVGNRVYLYLSTDRYMVGKVVDLLINGESVSSIENQYGFFIVQANYLPDYYPHLMVMTNVPHTTYQSVESQVENPFLTGLLTASNEIRETEHYYNILFQALAYGHFLVPAYKHPNANSFFNKIMGLFTSSSLYSFTALSTKEQNIEYLPVFTCTDAYLRSPKTPDNETDVLVLPFKDVVELCNRFTGNIVFNPYGVGVLFLPRKFIEEIITSIGYKTDFHAWQGDTIEAKMNDFFRAYFEEDKPLGFYHYIFTLFCKSVELPKHLDLQECTVKNDETPNTITFLYSRTFQEEDKTIKEYILKVDYSYDEVVKEKHYRLNKPKNKLVDNSFFQLFQNEIPTYVTYYCREKNKTII